MKKVSPYDCFRSGEARESIVKTHQEVEAERQRFMTEKAEKLHKK